MLRLPLVGVLLVSGCGFEVPNLATPDSLPDGTMPADTRPLEWTVVEMLTVPCSGQTLPSTTVLTANEMYRLRASGECTTNDEGFDDSHGDAEWAGYNVNNTVDSFEGVDIGLAVNHAGGNSKMPRWANTLATTHTYEVMFMGLGATVTLRYRDPDYTNNSGSLTFQILRFQ